MLDISDKTICIIGAKRSGRALCELTIEQGGKAKVSDCNYDEEFDRWANENNVEYEHGQHSLSFILESNIVVLSPGVSIHADIILQIKESHSLILGEIEFAAQFCDKPIIAVTGSNGKTTVSTLIHETLKEEGYSSHLCGNVGNAFARCSSDHSVDYFVIEVSSFQMESLINRDLQNQYSLKGFKPYIGVLLNFSENHLDRHNDLDEYFKAKTRLFINQGRDDFSLLSESNKRLKDFGKTLKSDVIFFDESKAVSLHNTYNPNHLAVYACADVLNIDKNIVNQIVKNFHGIEHRMELVRTVKGVDFINDSKADPLGILPGIPEGDYSL